MPFHQAWIGSAIGDMKHLMAVETSFPKGAIRDT